MTARQPGEPERRALPHQHEIIEQAADAAVKKTFAILGVDVDKPESVEEFREDLRFGRRLRKMTGHGQLVMVGAFALAIVYSLWAGFKAFAGVLTR